MKRLLIIKAGSTFPSIKKIFGDFDDFILRQIELDKSSVLITDSSNGEPLPANENISGIIITGSHSMVTDKEDWSENLAEQLRELVNTDIPILGICYGHQLLGHALGGKVDFHPDGKEFGFVDITLTEKHKDDILFNDFSEHFKSYAAHSQSVIELPAGAVLLAKNTFEKHHAFSFGRNIWGIQFHPEFTADITKMYIEETKDELIRSGLNPDQLINSLNDSPYGKQLLMKFYNVLCKPRQ